MGDRRRFRRVAATGSGGWQNNRVQMGQFGGDGADAKKRDNRLYGCRCKIEMSLGVQSRDDTPGGGDGNQGRDMIFAVRLSKRI
jgi:hypothetical protein